ncbi:hypothetical protein CDD83_9548 [Cordyceps sp. RAO-2017]|nr:hypothetical protein CDD83_9548 [Cordyceps sp. RAO-2017]
MDREKSKKRRFNSPCEQDDGHPSSLRSSSILQTPGQSVFDPVRYWDELETLSWPYRINFAFYTCTAKSSESEDEYGWQAFINIKARDIKGLMEEGFHFSEDNRLIGAEFYDIGKGPDRHIDPAWTRSRVYRLVDNQSHPAADMKQQWIATVIVDAAQVAELSRFRLSDLSMETMASCRAWNSKGQMIYSFDKEEPEASFNAILDEKPLKGWWPWPKAAKK